MVWAAAHASHAARHGRHTRSKASSRARRRGAHTSTRFCATVSFPSTSCSMSRRSRTTPAAPSSAASSSTATHAMTTCRMRKVLAEAATEAANKQRAASSKQQAASSKQQHGQARGSDHVTHPRLWEEVERGALPDGEAGDGAAEEEQSTVGDEEEEHPPAHLAEHRLEARNKPDSITRGRARAQHGSGEGRRQQGALAPRGPCRRASRGRASPRA